MEDRWYELQDPDNILPSEAKTFHITQESTKYNLLRRRHEHRLLRNKSVMNMDQEACIKITADFISTITEPFETPSVTNVDQFCQVARWQSTVPTTTSLNTLRYARLKPSYLSEYYNVGWSIFPLELSSYKLFKVIYVVESL